MRMQYLGTAAYEGTPAVFCTCATCTAARKAGGRNIRTHAQALVNERILLDFGPDTYAHALRYGLDLAQLHTCLITHTHSDHFYPEDLLARMDGYCTLQTEYPLVIYGSAETGEQLHRLLGTEEDRLGRLQFHEVHAFEPFEAEDCRITPLPAVHGTKQPLVYLIQELQRGGKTLLYAHDTYIFDDETWQWLADNAPHLDLVSLDCTMGLQGGAAGCHMSIADDCVVRDRLLQMGLADEHTHFIANHFSHNGGLTYDRATDPEVNRWMEISYDGMIVDF